jgi:hypothetical protein
MGITSVATSTDCKLAFPNECLLTIVIHLQVLFLLCKLLCFPVFTLQRVCVCVCERERERECVRVCVCVCELSIAAGGIIIVMASTLTIDLQRAIVYPYRRGTERDQKKLVNITQDLCLFLLVSFVLLLLL